MVSLFLQQLYREMLTVADEYGGKLPNRVMIFADEIELSENTVDGDDVLRRPFPPHQHGTHHPVLCTA